MRSKATDVFDVVCAFGLQGRWVADGMFIGMVAAM